MTGVAADVSSGADVAATYSIAIAKARCLDRISSPPQKSPGGRKYGPTGWVYYPVMRGEAKARQARREYG
jgi:hypothetical protein